MGIIVGPHGVVVRTEAKHVKLLAWYLDLHKWFKKQKNNHHHNKNATVTTTTHKQKVGWSPGPFKAQGSGFEIIKCRR